MEFIYVLKLHNNKKYVGKTKDINRRLFQHLNNEGSEWTKLHKPIIPLSVTIRQETSIHDENNITKALMYKFGIDNVRGGAYVNVKLSREEKNVLEKEIRSVNDLCFTCGEKGHYIKDCNKSIVNNDNCNKLITNNDNCNKLITNNDNCNKLITNNDNCNKLITNNDNCNKLITNNDKPPRAGLPWDLSEDNQLKFEVKNKPLTAELIIDISNIHERTVGAILSKLQTLRIINKDKREELYNIIYKLKS
jgi:predicted GIY-YIG superfamily endonuclease